MDCLIDAFVLWEDLTRFEVSKRGAAKPSQREPLRLLWHCHWSDENVWFYGDKYIIFLSPVFSSTVNRMVSLTSITISLFPRLWLTTLRRRIFYKLESPYNLYNRPIKKPRYKCVIKCNKKRNINHYMDIIPLKSDRFETRVSTDNIVCLDKLKSCGAYRTNWPNSIRETGIERCRCIRAGEDRTARGRNRFEEGRARDGGWGVGGGQ